MHQAQHFLGIGHRGPTRPRYLLRAIALGFITAILTLAACGDRATDDNEAPAEPAGNAANGPASFLPANSAASAGCIDEGLLRTTLYGALDGELRWSGDAMSCEGMPRPDGSGPRLRFAGTAGEDANALTIIIAVPGLARGATEKELPSNVTIISEGNGRFFSTTDLDNCWTDIERHEAIKSDSGRFTITGMLYCISPLAEVNGPASVLIKELEFSGLVAWEPQ